MRLLAAVCAALVDAPLALDAIVRSLSQPAVLPMSLTVDDTSCMAAAPTLPRKELASVPGRSE